MRSNLFGFNVNSLLATAEISYNIKKRLESALLVCVIGRQIKRRRKKERKENVHREAEIFYFENEAPESNKHIKIKGE